MNYIGNEDISQIRTYIPHTGEMSIQTIVNSTGQVFNTVIPNVVDTNTKLIPYSGGSGYKAIEQIENSVNNTFGEISRKYPLSPNNLLTEYSVNKPNFYVGPTGANSTLPSTAYRYMDLSKFDLVKKEKTDYLSYFGFKKYDNAYQARDAFQIKYDRYNLADSWSDAALRGEFDTLQLYDEVGIPKVRIPYEKGDRGNVLEPFTNSYPEFGKGGELQMVPKKWEDKIKVKYNKLDILNNPITDLEVIK